MLTKTNAAVLATGALAVTLGFTSPSQDSYARLRGSIAIDGSSTVFPITQAVAEEFKEKAPNVNVTIGVSGTGGGFKRFALGETDISDASRPIKKEEHDGAAKNGVKYIELPIAYDGLSFVVNKSNTWVDSLTVEELQTIFLASKAAKTWKDVRPSWPSKPITMYIPGTDSGTFDYFKEVVAGKEAIRADVSVSEDDNLLVRGVMGEEAALGFFGCAYYFENKDKLRVVPIVNPKLGTPVEPTPGTIEDGSYAPFSRPLFIYVNAQSARRPEVKGFVEFFLANAPRLSAEVGYVGLPAEVYKRASANFKASKTGTQYLNEKGEQVSGPVTTVYK